MISRERCREIARATEDPSRARTSAASLTRADWIAEAIYREISADDLARALVRSEEVQSLLVDVVRLRAFVEIWRPIVGGGSRTAEDWARRFDQEAATVLAETSQPRKTRPKRRGARS